MQSITGPIGVVPTTTRRDRSEPAKPKCLVWYEKIKGHSNQRDDRCANVCGYLRDDNMSTLAKIFGKFSNKRTTKKVHTLMPQPQLLLESSHAIPSVGTVTTFVAGRHDGTTLARLDERVAAYRSQRPKTRAPTRKDGCLKVARPSSRPHSSDRNRKQQYTLSEERIRHRKSKLGQPTRAQVFRNRFIRRKMLAVNNDKNDSWWNRFNVKLYYKDFYR